LRQATNRPPEGWWLPTRPPPPLPPPAAGLVNATDPELVVLSGLAAEMQQAAPERLARAYREGLMETLAGSPPPLLPGALGERGSLVGAMEAAFAPVLAHPPV
ncbi:MAG: hypothetical protein ACR2NR_14745, partial [Solirubrobacteraceae bacterium]